MQNNPFDDDNPLTPTIAPPIHTDHEGEWFPYPNAPHKPKRTIRRWVFLGVHGVLFLGMLVLFSSNLTNDLRLLLMGWGLLLIVHTVITCLLDVREGYVQERRIKRAIRQAEITQKRARMLEKLHKPE